MGRSTGWWSRGGPGDHCPGSKARVGSNESLSVPRKTPYRLENPGEEPVRIIEVQTESYLGENDIMRLVDDFWRGPDLFEGWQEK